MPDDPDRGVLVALYNATDGDNWTVRTNWLSDRPVGEWYGVTTDGDGRVTGLALSDNNLHGFDTGGFRQSRRHGVARPPS